jgi:DnaJ-class molecular chaperone
MATKTCPVCNGSGTRRRQNSLGGVNLLGSYSTDTCATCGGTGWVQSYDEYTRTDINKRTNIIYQKDYD